MLTTSSNGQVGAHFFVCCGVFVCSLLSLFGGLLLFLIVGSGKGRGDFVGESSHVQTYLLHLLQLRVCEEDSLEGYRPAAGDDDAFYSTLRRK